MAFRDKARERLQPFLEPGEQIHQVFWVRTGPRPYWILATYFILFATRYHVVAVTDRAIVVARSGNSTNKPKEVVARLPRSLALGPAKGLWYGPLYLTPDGKKSWVSKAFRKDVNAADEALAASGVQPIGHASQPPQREAVPPPNAEVPTPPPPPPTPTGEGTSF